jgi:hypothetical protein
LADVASGVELSRAARPEQGNLVMERDRIRAEAARLSSSSINPAVEATRPTGASNGAAHVRLAGRRAFIQLGSVVLGVAAITWYVDAGLRQKSPSPPPATPPELSAPEKPVMREPETSTNAAVPAVAEPDPPAAPPPVLDRAAVAEAEAALDAASRDRARSENRAAELARRVSKLSGEAALDAGRARKLAFLVRDPSTRIAQASSRGGFLRGERSKLERELTNLRQLPRPKYASILSKTPVARPADGDEYHFELRRNRVTVINLAKLLEFTKADAQVRIRLAERMPAISGKVGPVGAFSLEYELSRALPGSVEELLDRKTYFNFRAWELVPEFESRGETYEATRNPLSEFARAINRIVPGHATITLWVYPDSFAIYRHIRSELVEKGYSVAGRPLPEGMTIRGSPMGTHSAAQ